MTHFCQDWTLSSLRCYPQSLPLTDCHSLLPKKQPDLAAAVRHLTHHRDHGERNEASCAAEQAQNNTPNNRGETKKLPCCFCCCRRRRHGTSAEESLRWTRRWSGFSAEDEEKADRHYREPQRGHLGCSGNGERRREPILRRRIRSRRALSAVAITCHTVANEANEEEKLR